MNNKQKAFVYEYLKDFNATQAAIRAGYSAKTARSIGYENLTKPDIKTLIEQELEAHKMSADEVLRRMSDIARGDMADFMDPSTLMLDIRKAKENGKTQLIKKIKQRTVTKLGKNESDDDVEIHDLEIEIYPADSTLDKLARVHGLYNDRLNIDGSVEHVIKRVGIDIDEL